MPFLDINSAIKKDNIASRFKLVRLASQRSRELIGSSKEETIPCQTNKHHKLTTKALTEIIDENLVFNSENE